MPDISSPTLAQQKNLAQQRMDTLGELPQWRLTDLYPSMDSTEFTSDLHRVEHEAIAFAETYQGTLEKHTKTPSILTKAIREFEALEELLGRLISYAGLMYASDMKNPQNAKFYGDCQEKITAVSAHLLFFELELNRIDDDCLKQALDDPELNHFRPWLNDIRKGKPYQLEDHIERLFHEKSVTGHAAWNRLFNETISDLRFDIGGELLSIEPTLNLLQDNNAAKRKEAGQALAKTFSEHVRTFALITNVLAKDKEISDRWHGFKDVADSRHLANRVEPEVVDALVSAVREAYPRLSHRYYRLKAKWFGVDTLAYWDRNAPLPSVEMHTISWSDARDTVLTAYAGFSDEMANIAERFFTEHWIDAPIRPGKSPGAFAHPTVPSAHPYVLLNYQGKPRDVMTLAHELGHGVHQVLAAPNGALMAPTPLTLAETASVFGEMLTFRSILRNTTDPVQKKALLAGKVEDMINTVVRQIAFYSFEREVHLARKEGELTTEKLGEIWLSIQKESLGPAIITGPGYENFWCYIPHFIHSPFYVYAYAFGDCLVNSLYSIYEKSEDGFTEKYFDLLKAGGTKHHSELLAPFGLNASDPNFWSLGLTMIENLITELEKMD